MQRYARTKVILWGLALLTCAAVALYFYLLADLPPISAVETRLVRPTTQILDRHGRLLYEVIDPQAGKQINLDLASLPETCVQATLATEDARFYLHPGVDPIAILRALWQNYRAGGTVVSGGSTLTQQLARNLLLTEEERYTQSLRRKLREAWLAWQLELRYTKNELLALYLNQTYYGNFAFGLEAAAQVFFAKPAAQLSRGECTLLAGLVQYPSGYNPLHEPETAKLRQLTVLRLMVEAGYLTEPERTAIAAEPLRYRSNLFDIEAPHFVMYVQDLLTTRLGVDQWRKGGWQIVTTLDLDLQHQAEQAIRQRLELLNCRRPGVCDQQTDPNRRVDNAAAVILDAQSGEILAMVGSPDYFDATIQGNVNAALTLRQPGSAIKPLTYAAALDPVRSRQHGQPPLTPASILADLPTTFHVKDKSGGNVPYTPVNYDRRFHGPVSVRTALANSYNIPAVKTLNRIGVAALQQIASEAGISTFNGQFGLALTLGGGEVKLLELSAAFGIFQEGRRLETPAILQIDNCESPIADCAPIHDSSLITPHLSAVIQPETANLITDILADNAARIPAFGEGSVLELPFPAAVKTGTTTDWRDNWTIGYSTQRIVGVWVGNADNAPMLDVSGIDGAGPIWHDLMLAAHPQPPPPFSRPADIVEMTICAPSGLLPAPACPRLRQERFIRGTEPTQADDQFVQLALDSATGQPAERTTPAQRIIHRTFWQLGPEYHDWMIGQGLPMVNCELSTVNCNRPATSPVAGDPAGSEQPTLVLTAPTANTAYQLHPGLPAANQRLEVGGYVADGRVWAELRLVRDGTTLAQAANVSRLQTWWVLEPGQHRFWLEGKATADSEVSSSAPALVVVERYRQQVATNKP